MSRQSLTKVCVGILAVLASSSSLANNPWDLLFEASNKSKERAIKQKFEPLPVKQPIITSTFGEREHPITRLRKQHHGLDIAAPKSSEIISVAKGKVIHSGDKGTYGNMVTVEHENGLETRYAHAEKVLVGVGQFVEKGEPIATVGQTGLATGPHVHFEVRKNGKPIDPATFVDIVVADKPMALSTVQARFSSVTLPKVEVESAAQPVKPDITAIPFNRGVSVMTDQTLYAISHDLQIDIGDVNTTDIINVLVQVNPGAFVEGDPNRRKGHVPLFIPAINELAERLPTAITSKKSLWGIAKEHYPELRNHYSLYQIMVAIAEHNPKAFPTGNVNHRLASVPLYLPAEEHIAAITFETAKARFVKDQKTYVAKRQRIKPQTLSG